MASSYVAPFGSTGRLNLPDVQQLSVYTMGVAQVYAAVGPPNQAPKLALIATINNEMRELDLLGTYDIVIESGALPVYYEVGTYPTVIEAQNFFCLNPVQQNVSATITPFGIVRGLITSSPAAPIALTLPGQVAMNAATNLAIFNCLNWSIVNQSANAITMTVVLLGGHVYAGNVTIAANVSASFKTVRDGVTNFTTYRIA